MSAALRLLSLSANTDCGKTVVSAGLVRAAVRASGEGVRYVKPVQTGADPVTSKGGDAEFVRKWAGTQASATTLWTWRTPASPHVSAELARNDPSQGVFPPPSSPQIITAIAKDLEQHSRSAKLYLVEGAGGVLSPLPDRTLLADGLAPLVKQHNFRVFFVGDAKLGGISTTLTSLEALDKRGMMPAAVAFLERPQDDALGVAEFVRSVVPRSVTVVRIRPFPVDPTAPLNDFYASSTSSFSSLLQQLSSSSSSSSSPQ